jgi:hypothetical protein
MARIFNLNALQSTKSGPIDFLIKEMHISVSALTKNWKQGARQQKSQTAHLVTTVHVAI